MLVKIDFEKAYDQLNWNFIENCLEESKFPPKLIQVTHYCIMSTTYNFMWNGKKMETFHPSSGIR